MSDEWTLDEVRAEAESGNVFAAIFVEKIEEPLADGDAK